MSPRRLNLLIWLAPLALLALTVGLALLDLSDRAGLILGALIAVAKAAPVVGVYMEILRRGHLPRLAGVTLLSFLAVMFGITLELAS
jgi:caa(3)-type oxidase subunit IV